MISMFGGGLAVGSTVVLILVIYSLHTGKGLTKDIEKAVALLSVGLLGVIAAAFAIHFERAKTP
jgi:hypothetical protein